MNALHFGIRSGKRGTASTHLSYVTRGGRHAKRGDLVETGYGNMPSWAQDNPSLLWKASDTYERKNGSTFRSFIISLPNVLTIEQLRELARDEAQRLAGSYPYLTMLSTATCGWLMATQHKAAEAAQATGAALLSAGGGK